MKIKTQGINFYIAIFVAPTCHMCWCPPQTLVITYNHL